MSHELGSTPSETASIVASSHDAILGMTSAGKINSCNPAAARLYGYRADELVGRSVQLLVPPELREEEAEVLRRIVAGQEVGPYRTERLRRDGTVVTVTSTISPIVDAAGSVVGAASFSRRAGDLRDSSDGYEARVDRQRADVRDAEARFQAGLDVERVKEREQVEESQRRFQAAMDIERSKERVQVQQAEDRFQRRMEDERAKERVHVQDAEDRFQLGMEDERARERLHVQDAEDRFQVGIEAERATERAQAKDAQNRFQLGIDIERAEAQSDRDRLEAQLQQGQRLEVLGQLAGGVAHDFNNLLAVILNYAAFVTEELGAGPEADVDAAVRDVAQIQRAAERASVLTHQLLAFARREVVRPVVLDLNDVVTDVQELLRRTIGEDVSLETELAPDLWSVLMDAGQMEQVLLNLAVNARDAMPTGGRFRVETANILGPDLPGMPGGRAGRHVRVKVSDTGSGMSDEVQDHVFEPFFTTKAEGMGTGLGLATAYGIVAQAGGTITVQSQLGRGTSLTIALPVTDEEPAPVGRAVAGRRASRGELILVVEDEESLREVTERIFASNGYQVITAADGVEAIALAADHAGEIHLLVTDVVMPKMLGDEVAARIRRIRPGIEVLYMSGYNQHLLASRSELDRDVHLIEKPFSAAALLGKVGQILGGHGPDPAADGSAPPTADAIPPGNPR